MPRQFADFRCNQKLPERVMCQTRPEDPTSMAQYRMYVVENSGRFRWPYDVSASCDGDALSIARAAQYVCSDVPVAVELWDGARKVPGTSNRAVRPSRDLWEQVSTAQPEALLRLTQALRNSVTA